MLIDWFTVGAQALNFVILILLMKHFLYKPILNAIDAREKRIAGELADASAKKIEAQKERDDLKHKNDELDAQRAALLKKAIDEAGVERKRLLDEATKAADALSAKRQDTMKHDVADLAQAIRLRTEHEVFAIARKALADLATSNLEDRIGDVFARRLREMSASSKATLAKALSASSEPALVRSAFDMSAEQRAIVQKVLNEVFSSDVHLRFETSPELIGGIELSSSGQKVGWTIADYVSSLEEGVVELLKGEVAKAS